MVFNMVVINESNPDLNEFTINFDVDFRNNKRYMDDIIEYGALFVISKCMADIVDAMNKNMLLFDNLMCDINESFVIYPKKQHLYTILINVMILNDSSNDLPQMILKSLISDIKKKALNGISETDKLSHFNIITSKIKCVESMEIPELKQIMDSGMCLDDVFDELTMLEAV